MAQIDVNNKVIYRANEEFDRKLFGEVVFTNGCFDILHPGHLAYLREAKELGDFLIVGLNSDRSINVLKGVRRPINNFEYRSHMLQLLDSVDFILEFDDETPSDLIRSIRPNILVKGGDYRSKIVEGADFVISNGGRLEFIKFLEGYSTSSLIARILDSYRG